MLFIYFEIYLLSFSWCDIFLLLEFYVSVSAKDFKNTFRHLPILSKNFQDFSATFPIFS
jgi:hypothetical protein